MKPVLEQGDTVTTCFGDLNDVWGWGLMKKYVLILNLKLMAVYIEVGIFLKITRAIKCI